jgi:hypothetical protein
MTEAKYIAYFNGVQWSYFSEINVHNLENSHGVRMYFVRETKHNPPRAMWQIAFPMDKTINVYIKTVKDDNTGITHLYCTPVRKNSDKIPDAWMDVQGDIRATGPKKKVMS